MQKQYESSSKQLAAYFESSRDKWKKRSSNVQKEKRRLLVEIRDIRKSRDKWKAAYYELKEKHQALLDEKKNEETGIGNPEGLSNSDLAPVIPGHSFSGGYILLAMAMYLRTQAGFRGVSTVFTELQKHMGLEPVGHCCVRQWVLRLGHGLLNQPVDRSRNWIYIADFSIRLGKERCLLILGATQENIAQQGYCLGHGQVRVLDICVGEHFSGRDVFERFTALKEKTGVPKQIVSDNGNDIKKGVELFREANASVTHTYDITHMIGTCLKHSLEPAPEWFGLQSDLRGLAQQTKQSGVSFLRPIATGKKARWLNIGGTVEWLERIYDYEQKADFHLISQGFRLLNAQQVYDSLKDGCKNKLGQQRLWKTLGTTVFKDRSELEGLKELYGIPESLELITVCAGKFRFNEKFKVFLDKYRDYLPQLVELKNMTEGIKSIVKSQGLSMGTLQQVGMLYDNISTPWVMKVFHDINNRLQVEHSKGPFSGMPLLACSDIIESLFGKFKAKAKQTVGGIYQTILTTPLFCCELTEKVVGQILTTVKMEDVNNWFKQMIGTSNLAKRRSAFG